MDLRVLSFHSVKGGVGKSTLSTLAALHVAASRPKARVWLVDMDLTGTSLADALPLCAPSVGSTEDPQACDLHAVPDGHLGVKLTRDLMDQRSLDQQHPGPPHRVPFLNDWLLYAAPSWDPAHDASVEAVAWRLEGGPDNLRVLPSSALPVDLAWILPVIFDEEHAAFLEGRLELLLAALSRFGPEVWVVFDVPPTIPGLSRALLGLALRLGHPTRDKQPLSTQDPWIPPELVEADLRWLANLIATPDHQDLRAAARWVGEITPDDEPVFRVVLNRAGATDDGLNRRELESALASVALDVPLWRDCMFIPDSPAMRIFRGGHIHEGAAAMLEPLVADLG